MMEAKKENLEKKWYIVHTHTGYELNAKQSIEQKIKKESVEDFFGDILVPEENVVKLVKGKKSTRSRRFFPGYIFIHMHMNNKTWHLVKTCSKVSKFVGGNTNPPEVPEEEVLRVTQQMKKGVEQSKKSVNFTLGENVKVVDGPFMNFTGSVSDINEEKEKVTVLVSIFGRQTPVELDFLQVDRLD